MRFLFALALLAMAADASAQRFRGGERPETAPEPSTSNALGNPEGMVDRLVLFDTEAAWSAGVLENASLTSDALHVTMQPRGRERFPDRGTWTSPEVKTDFRFTEMIPSWNALTPGDTGVVFEVRSHDAETSTWSPWLFAGRWGRTPEGPTRRIHFERGMIHVDVLRLDAPADAFQLRARMYDYDLQGDERPQLRRMAAVYSGVVEDAELRARLTTPPQIRGEWARSLAVPFDAQTDENPAISGSICSPTSLSMVMRFCGVDFPAFDNAMAVYDPDYGIFGTWSRATQRAGSLGLDAWLTRMRSWDQVKACIADNQPVIASVRFREGEFPSSVLKQTGGHLIVVRGFTPEGDVIVNDPANLDRGEGAVYKADELARAWFDKGGIAYIVRAPEKKDSDKLTAGESGSQTPASPSKGGYGDEGNNHRQ